MIVQNRSPRQPRERQAKSDRADIILPVGLPWWFCLKPIGAYKKLEMAYGFWDKIPEEWERRRAPHAHRNERGTQAGDTLAGTEAAHDSAAAGAGHVCGHRVRLHQFRPARPLRSALRRH